LACLPVQALRPSFVMQTTHWTLQLLLLLLLLVTPHYAAAGSRAQLLSCARRCLVSSSEASNFSPQSLSFSWFGSGTVPIVELSERDSRIDLDDFTFSAWLLADTFSDGMLVAEDRAGDGKAQFRLALTPDGYLSVAGLGVACVPPQDATHARDGNGYSQALTSKGPLQLSRWTHVLLTRSARGTRMTLYVDGELHGDVSTEAVNYAPAGITLRVGSRYPSSGNAGFQPFPGRIRAARWLPGHASTLTQARNENTSGPVSSCICSEA